MKSSMSPVRANLCLQNSIRQLKIINTTLVKTILLVLALLCLAATGFGQLIEVRDFRLNKEPLFVGSWVKKDVPLGKFINYKDSTATLKDFNRKLVILDFWFTHCSDCIAQFPKEDSLQKAFNKDIQFILVTFDSEKTVKDFFSRWEAKTGIHLSMPMIVADTLLSKVFRHFYEPHYAWIGPEGMLLGQTNQSFINKEAIQSLIIEKNQRKARYDQIRAYQKAHPRKDVKKNSTY